jgi:hypothetical protein
VRNHGPCGRIEERVHEQKLAVSSEE